MTHKLYFALSAICLIAVIATQCSNAPSRTTTTSQALPVASASDDQAAVAEPCQPTAENAQEEALVASSEVAVRPQPRSAAAAAAATTVARASSEADGLRMRRLIVSEGVENREPVGASSRFSGDEERIYAFMEMVNTSDEDRQVVVTFESDDGTSVGHINVNVPANAPRWRTWAYTGRANTPGTWTAVISTPDGSEIGRERFEIES